MRQRLVLGIGVVAILGVIALCLSRRGVGEHLPTSKDLKGYIGARTSKRMEKPATLSGRVTRASDGTAIPRAIVSISEPAPAGTGADNDTTITTATDASGRWTTSEVLPGQYVVAATATGFVPATVGPVSIASGDHRSDIELSLEAGGVTVSGTVCDIGGGPVAGVRIIARDDHGSAALVAISGADGDYQLGLAAGAYQLEAVHDDYTSAWQNVKVVLEPLSVDFDLIPGGVVEGHVTARDTGQPVADAVIEGELGETLARSDQYGNFVIRRLPAREIQIGARGHGYATKQLTRVALGVGEQVDRLELVADREFRIAGRVVLKDDPNRGLEGVKVKTYTRLGPLSAVDPSDADGRFEIPGTAPGSYQIFVSKPGFLVDMSTKVDVVDKDVTDVTIEMTSGATVSGRVEPPAVARIGLLVEPDPTVEAGVNELNALTARTDSDGNGVFTLRNIPNGNFQISAVTKDGLAGTLPIVVAGRDQSGLCVRIAPRASISGRVVDPDGKPVAGAFVAALQRDRRPSSIMRTDGNWPMAESAPDGTFRIVGLAAGSYSVSVPQAPRVDVELVDAVERSGVTLVVDRRDGVIRGQVIGVDGNPVADVWVSAVREAPGKANPSATSLGSPGNAVLTDANGGFLLEGLRSGTYTLVADGPRGESHGTKSGAQLGGVATIVLAPAGTLVVKVTQGGSLVAKCDIACSGSLPGTGAEANGVSGTSTFARLPAGEYECSASTDVGVAEAKVTLSPGGTSQLDIDIQGWASLTGVVVGVLTGEPVSGLQVFSRGGVAASDASGRFVLERVAAGTGELLLMPKDQITYGFEARSYTAKPGERVDLGTIKIVPPRNGEEGTYGFALEARDNAVVVMSVIAEGPAAQAGIRAGDAIVSVDGRSVGDLGIEVAKRLLASGNVGVGQTVTIGLKRDATIKLTAVKWN